MAFGRSNSLSLNTGATNNLFSQQNNTQQNNPSTQAGSLFGGSAAAAAAPTNTSQPTQSFFGGSSTTNNAPAQSTGSLFGGPLGQPQTQTQTGGGGGLFGSAQTSQPQQQSGGLFGSTAPAQQQQSGGLFGSSTTGQTGGLFGASTAQQPQQQTSSLFGASTAQQPAASGGLFGNLGQSTTQPQQQQQSTSLFGGGNSLFNSTSQSQQPAQNPPPGNSIFGLSAVPPSHLPQASLLAASQYRQLNSSTTNPTHAQSSSSRPFFSGRLSMGQNHQSNPSTNPSSNPNTVGAVKISYTDLRPTTRFSDCVDDVKTQFEAAEKMILQQEAFCSQIQALLSQHETDVLSLSPDVSLVAEKADRVEENLIADAYAVDSQRKMAVEVRRDFERCARVVENLRLPAGWHVGNLQQHGSSLGAYSGGGGGGGGGGGDEGDSYDTDLIGHYFLPLTTSLQTTLESYTRNLAEIEAHVRVIEQATVQQAQGLMARKNGGGSGSGREGAGGDTVRELAETLRGFESSILGVAGLVGECREGVNGLVLGRVGGGGGAAGGGRGRAW